MAGVVAILDCNFPNTTIERNTVEEAGLTLIVGQCATEDQVVNLAHDVDGIIVQYAPLTARVIGELRRCKVIARYGIGVDNVDVPAASARGIWVTNVPGFCATELAEHTMAFVLASGRRLTRLDRAVRDGRWETIGVMGPTRRLSELTLGLVGFGRVGREVATRARAFGLRVIAAARTTGAATMQEFGVEQVELDEIFRQADFVSLNLPATAETRHLVNARRLALMKPSAYLVNTSRGAIVDEKALIAALREGRLAGAGLDVLETEPPSPSNPLLQLDNVIITPHAAYYSDDSLAYLQGAVSSEVVGVLSGRPPRSPVNPGIAPRVVS
jgi:D-3-phosphoglycerate dehydrogenase